MPDYKIRVGMSRENYLAVLVGNGAIRDRLPSRRKSKPDDAVRRRSSQILQWFAKAKMSTAGTDQARKKGHFCAAAGVSLD